VRNVQQQNTSLHFDRELDDIKAIAREFDVCDTDETLLCDEFILPDRSPTRATKQKQNGDVLLAAHAVINKGRQGSYGPPSRSFARTAALWSAYLGNRISKKDVAVCLALLKLSRESFRHKTDNLLDAAGYIGLAQDLAEVEEDEAAEIFESATQAW
jgi:hypothetical protein